MYIIQDEEIESVVRQRIIDLAAEQQIINLIYEEQMKLKRKRTLRILIFIVMIGIIIYFH